MDRYLLSGAILTLMLESLVLMADLGLISPFSSPHQQNQNSKIGQLIATRENVRHKNHNSLIWENSQERDQLFAYDSILTLDNSTAKIQLDNDVNINLYENTLVVLEPQSRESDSTIRLKFSRGNMHSRVGRKFKVGSGEWSFEAQPGSDLNLRSTEDHKIEVEVNKGRVVLENKKQHLLQEVHEGFKLNLSENKVDSIFTIAEDLKWKTTTLPRVYSHSFPAAIQLSWEGEAQLISYFKSSENRNEIPVQGQTSLTLLLNPGTYYFNLKNKNFVSQTFTLEIIPAPKIRYFSPLPRDRIELNTPQTFSWLRTPYASSHLIQFSKYSDFRKIDFSFQSKNNITDFSFKDSGAYYWHVIQLDENGYQIPAYFSYPVYSVKNPFSPPIIELPQREPTNTPKKKSPPNQSSWWQQFIQIVLPQAQAEESKLREVTFRWQAIEGADFYFVEVSKTPDFENPIINEKVYQNDFTWAEAYVQDVYYLRVAAGDSSGRMGLFSTPQAADLRLLEKTKVGKSSPTQKIATPPQQLDPNLLPPPTPPEATESLAPKEKVVEKIAPSFTGGFMLGSGFNYISQKKTNDFNAEFNGLSTFKIFSEINFDDWKYTFLLNYIQWKVKNPEKFPFQGNLEEFKGSANIYKKWGPIYAGFSIDSDGIFKRKDLESLQMTSETTYGLSVLYEHQFQNIPNKYSFDIHLNKNVTKLSLNALSLKFFEISKWNIHFGVDIHLNYLIMKNDAQGFSGDIGVLAGYSW